MYSQKDIVCFLRDGNTAVVQGYTGKDCYVQIPNMVKLYTVTAIDGQGSYAEQCCRENKIQYTY